ncbi:MAG: FHA domain-containing protein [Candidatus Cloacimonetes bacterium]|jgi:hypothetical protein|nr:FHA domain-containing protein [Candidatus Cloacimonadota bacterium]MCK9334505.1 FHA domain-containing protein [Candidatus Cloacimonadota bacterium]
MRYVKAIVALTLLMLVSFLLSAHEIKQHHIDARLYPSIKSYFALSQDSSVIDDLVDDLAVNVDGSYEVDSLKITAFKTLNKQYNVLICIDTSGSMSSAQLRNIRESLGKVIMDLPENVRLSISIFGNEMIILNDYSLDKEILQESVNNIKTLKGNTYLHYSIDKALKRVIERKLPGLNSVLFISDGKEDVIYDVVSPRDREQTIASSLMQSIPIHTIGYSVERSPDFSILDYYASKTNGIYGQVKHSKELHGLIARITELPNSLHELSFTVCDLAGDGNYHMVNISFNVEDEQFTSSTKVKFPDNKMQHKKVIYASGFLRYLPILIALAFIVLLFVILAVWRRKRLMLLHHDIKQKEDSISDCRISTEAKSQPEDANESIKPSVTLKMEFLSGADSGKIYMVDANGATIGRNSDNSIILADNAVSRTHAIIEYKDDRFIIRDLESANGITINSRKVSRSEIHHNDRFSIGSSEGIFSIYEMMETK